MENKNTLIGIRALEGNVAKSFVGWEILSEPFTNEKGALYITVRNPKTENARDVRFYHKAEPKTAKVSATPVYNTDKRNMAYPFGFTTDKNGKDGTITIYTNTDYEEHKELLASYGCRWNKWFGWYAPAGATIIPEDEMPEGVSTIELPYSAISDADGYVLPDAQLRAAVDSILYTPRGEHVGNPGERIEATVTVTGNREFTTNYGISHCITMEDAAGHTFVWFTAAKSWEVGTLHHIRATIKDHTEYKGLRQTVITRAMEVK